MSTQPVSHSKVLLKCYFFASDESDFVTIECDRSQTECIGKLVLDRQGRTNPASRQFDCVVEHGKPDSDISWSTKICHLPPDIRTLPVFLPVIGPAQQIMRKYRVIEVQKNVLVHDIMKAPMSAGNLAPLLVAAEEGETLNETITRIQQEADAKKIPGTAGPPRTTSEAANAQLRVKVRDLENKVVELEDVIVQQKIEIKELKTSVSELLLDKEESKRQIKDLQSDMARVLALFDESAARKLGNENESLKKDLQAMEDVKDAKEAENISLTVRVNTLEREVRGLNGRVNNLTEALVPVRRRILIDNVRFKIMKAVLGLSIFPKGLSWINFLQDPRMTEGQPFNEDLAAARLIKYIKDHSIPIAPLVDADLEMICLKAERDESNRMVHHAAAEELQLVVDCEVNEVTKRMWQRMMQYQV
ncbi:hypothetical protein CPC08DRAFT_792730 [Agrocybe pediades]|nr:hypothetical protein CPC08DRAFT_792730 [Agrocybe pediades]